MGVDWISDMRSRRVSEGGEEIRSLADTPYRLALGVRLLQECHVPNLAPVQVCAEGDWSLDIGKDTIAVYRMLETCDRQ